MILMKYCIHAISYVMHE